MKFLIVSVVLVSLVSLGCGDQSLTGPSLTSNSKGQKQTQGSTVAILDQVVAK